MIAALIVIVPLLLTLAGLVLCAEAIAAPRARHAGAGAGALNVWQLVEDEPAAAAGRHRLRGPEPAPVEDEPEGGPPERGTVPPDLMQRVLDGLRAL